MYDMKSVFLATVFQSSAVLKPAPQPPGFNVSLSATSVSKCKTCSVHEKEVKRLMENKLEQAADIYV